MRMDSSRRSKVKIQNNEEKELSRMSQTSPQTDIASKGSLTSPKPDSVSEKSISKAVETQKSNSRSNTSNGSQNEEKTPLFMSFTDSSEQEFIAKKVENVSKQMVLTDSQNLQMIKEFLTEKQYQLIESLWIGNYGEIFKAIDSSNRFVAIKVIELRKISLHYRKKFFPREIDLMRKLKHNSILKFFKIIQNEGKIFVIMEYAVNGSLADWLTKNGSMNETTAWKVFKKVLDALHYMHSLKCAHRDLKVENILLTEGYEPKLNDFGFAIEVDERHSLRQTFCGCLPYSAPEILMRKPYNPFQTDIWALGVCVYVMVNNGFPFQEMDIRVMIRMQLNKEWNFKEGVVSSLSPNIKTMIGKMLEPVFDDRHTTLTLMSDPWFTSHQSTQPTQ